MVIDSYILVQTVTLAVFFGILEVFYMIFGKKQREANALKRAIHQQQGVTSITRWQLIKNKISNIVIYKKYVAYINDLLDLSFDDNETAESIIRTQEIVLIAGFIMSTVVSLLISPVMGIAVFLVILLLAAFPVIHYQSIVDRKNKEFDRMLPRFINQIIMVLRIGVSMENAFGYGLQSMEESLARREYEKFVAEMSIHPDDIQRVFLNLNKRVRTEECERFCNIIVSGLKNGNKMSDILENEYERICDNQLAEMKKLAESKKTIATIINVLFIFVPAILLLVIPMMQLGEMS